MNREQMQAHLTLHGWEVYGPSMLVSQAHGTVYSVVGMGNVVHLRADTLITTPEEWGIIADALFWRLAIFINEKGLL